MSDADHADTGWPQNLPRRSMASPELSSALITTPLDPPGLLNMVLLYGGATPPSHKRWPPDDNLYPPEGSGVYSFDRDSAFPSDAGDIFAFFDDPRPADPTSWELGTIEISGGLQSYPRPLTTVFDVGVDVSPFGAPPVVTRHSPDSTSPTPSISPASTSRELESVSSPRFDLQARSAQLANTGYQATLATLHRLSPDTPYSEELLRDLCVDTGESSTFWECCFKVAGHCDRKLHQGRKDHTAMHIGGSHLGFRFHCSELKADGNRWYVQPGVTVSPTTDCDHATVRSPML